MHQIAGGRVKHHAQAMGLVNQISHKHDLLHQRFTCRLKLDKRPSLVSLNQQLTYTGSTTIHTVFLIKEYMSCEVTVYV